MPRQGRARCGAPKVILGLDEVAVDAPAPLAIQLLGGFRVAVQGRRVPADAWRQRRAAGVVKLLALAPSHRLHREQLIDALWPELDAEAAANNLRVAVHRARRRFEAEGAAPERFLSRDGDDVILAAADDLWVDVNAFEAAVSRAWLTEDPAASRLAIDLYAGDLLPGDLYEDWVANRRTELRTSYLALLARLARLHEQRGEPGRAIASLQRLLETDPLDEASHTAQIRLLAHAGETRQAELHYERLVDLLDRELGTEPEAPARELMAAIREGRFAAASQPLAPLAPEQPIAARSGPPAGAGLRGLPVLLEDLIGREREIAELQRLLASHRLVTLTGPGGVGKTRLALAVANAAVGAWDGSARFVDLAPLRDRDLVLLAIAWAFGVQEEGDQPILDSLAARLGAERFLLVLDTFEQVMDAAPLVADLLAVGQGLTILVTSRGRLRLRGEQEYPVQPLSLPAAGTDSAPQELAEFPAVALFTRRAREAEPSFALDDAGTRAIVDICRRLDALPLAIELAAARVRILPPVALLERLERPLTLLTGGPRDAPARQQTLRAAIAWSHDLLSPEEQTLFARLAVFAGGCTIDAAEWVAGTEAGEGRREAGEDTVVRPGPPQSPRHPDTLTPSSLPILDLIASLIDQGLLRRTTASDGPRFAMLETIREFAAEQLAASGQAAHIHSRHAAYFLALAERLEPELTGPAATTGLAELETEHANLRAAQATLAQDQPQAALRLAAALWRFWWLHGHLSEGRSNLERALAQAASSPTVVRARAFDGAGALAAAQGDLAHATELHAQALRLWQDAGDPEGEISALTNLGLTADEQGDPRRATEHLQAALTLARDIGSRRGAAVALANLGQVAMTQADHEQAAALLGESVTLFRELGDRRSQAAILANLGLLALLMGEFERARVCHEEALTLFRDLHDRQGEADELLNLGHAVQRLGNLERAATLFRESLSLFEQFGDRSGQAFALNHLGWLAHLRGDEVEAESYLAQGLSLAQEIDDRVVVAEALEALAGVTCTTGDASRAAQLLGAAEALREAIGVPLPEVHRQDVQIALAGSRQALGEERFLAAQTRGRDLILESLVTPLGLRSGPVNPQ